MEKNSESIPDSSSNPSKLGLLCHYRFPDGSSQLDFLHFGDHMRAVCSKQLAFSTENYIQTVGSCNGLLLLISMGETQRIYHVFNPLNREIVASIPQPCIPRCVISAGLAFDGHHYRVVLVHIPNLEYDSRRSVSATVELEVFSSETMKWRRHTPKDNLSLPFPPPADVFSELATPPLFSNGAIHWEISGRLLVYNVQGDYCKLIELPTEWCIYQGCLWESEGRVNYSYKDSEGVHTWVLLNELDLDYYSKFNINDYNEFPWKLGDSLHFKTLEKNNPEICEQGRDWAWEPHYLSPIAYNEASQTMYLQLPGIVVSYNTTTGVLEQVCSFKFPDDDFTCCSFLPFVYSGQGQPSDAETVLELPIEEVVSSLSF